jgi:hypothetical protein
VLRRYKEIVFGGALGVFMWLVDAVMHRHIGEPFGASSFIAEVLNPGATQVVFRSMFVAVAVAFGWALWRSNWRERELEVLEDAIAAFHRRADSPAVRLVSNARLLSAIPSVRNDERAREIVHSIAADAKRVDDLSRGYLEFSELVRSGRTDEAVKVLETTRAWAGER